MSSSEFDGKLLWTSEPFAMRPRWYPAMAPQYHGWMVVENALNKTIVVVSLLPVFGFYFVFLKSAE